MTWVSWKECLASKTSGGLGIGSIYGLNVCLLFKWIWRFLQNVSSDFWIKIIKTIYGHHGGIFDGLMHRSSLSSWCGIVSSINSFKLKGVDLLSLCTRKLGNGGSIRFWEDVWNETLPLKAIYPRVYLLDSDRNYNVANRVPLIDWSQVFRRIQRGGIEATQLADLMGRIGDVVLSDHNDAWNWSPNTSKGFSVASARNLIDSHILEVSPTATRCNRCIPLKVNIFLWKLSLNKLPSRVNLDRRGIDVPSILCLICQEDVETANHIFFTYEMASTLWSMLAKWWVVDIPICANMADWISWLDSSHFPKKVCVFLDGVGGVLLWHIWRFQNDLIFSNSSPKKALLWDKIVS